MQKIEYGIEIKIGDQQWSPAQFRFTSQSEAEDQARADGAESRIIKRTIITEVVSDIL